MKGNKLFNLKVGNFYIYYDSYLEKPSLIISLDMTYLGDSYNKAASLSTNI